MSWVETIVLGIVQGLTEFLPISSSAHLRITSALFFGHDPGASFTAVTQLGTEAAVLVYFARDITRLIRAWLRGLVNRDARDDPDYRLAWYVIVGTIPIGVLGFLFRDEIRTAARNLWLVATTLIVFALVLAAADSAGRKYRTLDRLTWRDGLILGGAQALALIPGVSRSGATISAGLFAGLTREAATRYSFLLAIPAVVASGLFSLPDVLDDSGPGPVATPAQLFVATTVAFVLGYASIAWLLRWVAHHSVYVFVWYRIALGAIIIGILASGTVAAT